MASHDVAIGRRSVLAGSVAATIAAVAAVVAVAIAPIAAAAPSEQQCLAQHCLQAAGTNHLPRDRATCRSPRHPKPCLRFSPTPTTPGGVDWATTPGGRRWGMTRSGRTSGIALSGTGFSPRGISRHYPHKRGRGNGQHCCGGWRRWWRTAPIRHRSNPVAVEGLTHRRHGSARHPAPGTRPCRPAWCPVRR